MKIGVIGAGVIGTGVAHRFAQYGYDVSVVDIDPGKEKVMRRNIKNSIMGYNLVNGGEKKVDYKEVLEKISFSTELESLGECEYVIENVTEKIEIKKEVYLKLYSICNENCIFLVNTSCIPITKIAGYTSRKEKVIGAHFMNPVPMKNACEVIRGCYTSEETIKSVSDFLGSAGIKPIIVNDMSGFVSNRVSHVFMNEAAMVVQDGVASPEDVDAIFKECFGHKMGPLETADLIGIDTVVYSLDVLYEYYHDPKYRAAPIMKKMVDAGQLGRKSGKGFYNY